MDPLENPEPHQHIRDLDPTTWDPKVLLGDVDLDKPIPLRALILSFAALFVPISTAVFFPDWSGGEPGLLLWLTATVPRFQHPLVQPSPQILKNLGEFRIEDEVSKLVGIVQKVVELFRRSSGSHEPGLLGGKLSPDVQHLHQGEDRVLKLLVGVELGVGPFGKEVANVFKLFSPHAPDPVNRSVTTVTSREYQLPIRLVGQ